MYGRVRKTQFFSQNTIFVVRNEGLRFSMNKNVSVNLGVSLTKNINMKINAYEHVCEYVFNCESE